MKAKNNSNVLALTRVFDAPLKLVWEAWTDPKKVAKWWGPRSAGHIHRQGAKNINRQGR